MILDYFNADELVHAAFRYFLGRRTISANAFAKDLAAAWDHIGELTRMMIADELMKAYREAEEHPEWKPLGDDCDREVWDLVKDKVMLFSYK
jgi:hypothetical protein